MSRPRRPRPSRYDVLTELEKQLTLDSRLAALADDWEGPKAFTPDETGRRSKGGHSDPTGSAATNPDHDTTQLTNDVNTYRAQVVAIEELILGLRGARANLEPLTQDQAKNAKTPDTKAGVGACKAEGCTTWCSGTSGSQIYGTTDDRLKAGYCETHYRQWTREGRPEKLLSPNIGDSETPACVTKPR